MPVTASATLAQRLWAKVDKRDDGCWIFTGYLLHEPVAENGIEARAASAPGLDGRAPLTRYAAALTARALVSFSVVHSTGAVG